MDANGTAQHTTEIPTCRCCGFVTSGGNYLPGHDAKHVRQCYLAVLSGHWTPRQAEVNLPTPALRGKLAARLDKAGVFQRAQALIDGYAAKGWASDTDARWLNYGYESFGRMKDDRATSALDKALAILAYFQTTDYQPTQEPRVIVSATLRRAS